MIILYELKLKKDRVVSIRVKMENPGYSVWNKREICPGEGKKSDIIS
jgi:hypothetical protein